MKKDLDLFNNDNIHNILRSSGYVRDPQDVNVLEIFYNLYNKIPFVTDMSDLKYFLWDELYNELKLNFPDIKVIFQNKQISVEDNVSFFKQQTLELKEGLMIVLEGNFSNINFSNRNKFLFDANNSKNISNGKNNYANYFVILSSYEMENEEYNIFLDIFNKCKVEEDESVNIGMVSMDNGSYYVKDFDIRDGIIDLNLLDLHYGVGFETFNNNLLDRLLNRSKGLTLLHGDPGTGKTTYIRYLIKQIMKSSKDNNILYFPPTMVDFITDPSFINFVSDWVADNKGKTFLLIEDAEPLLESRNQSRNLGITNLLNLTDGILNDIFNIQIIATFNTKLQNLDQALLRPERLLARKEFNELTIQHGKELAKHLEIDEERITKKMSLAEIYSLKKDSEPLTHDIIDDVKIGFNK